jgi:hypothetical protein
MLRKLLLGGAAAATLVLAGSGVALAVSDGGYDYERQHCSAHAASTIDDSAEPGCHSATVSVYDGSDSDPKATSDAKSPKHEYLNVGTQQQPDGAAAPAEGGDATVEGHPVPFGNGTDHSSYQNPREADPTQGMNFYFGSDDNLDNGEHDNSELGSGGPSDGGAITVNVDPANVAWLAALGTGDPATILTYISHNPVPFVNAQIGMGADGHDMTITTNQRTIYEGGCDPNNPPADTGTCPAPRDAGDYEGMNWDPPSCSGPSDTAEDCSQDGNGWTLGDWHNHRGTTYAEPGIQIYEDPDPQGSPEPAEAWPQPTATATTCGVYAGGGPANFTGAPGANGAGQLQAENPSCSDTNGG